MAKRHLESAFLLTLPLLWGLLTFACLQMFDIYRFQNVKTGHAYWLIRMVILLPLWIYFYRRGLLEDPVGKPSLGTWRFYLGGAYALAFLATFGPNLGFFTRATFGSIVSPILEEYLCRAPLRRWLGNPCQFAALSVLSSGIFASMHWFYLYDFGASLRAVDAAEKFLAHFLFSLLMCVVFYFTKRIQIPILLHGLSNLRWVPAA